MSEIKSDDGGPAFPRPESEWEGVHGKEYARNQKGMSILDWFAGQAMKSLVAKAPLLDREGEHGPKFDQATLDQFRRDMAVSAYDYAAAMVAEKRRRS